MLLDCMSKSNSVFLQRLSWQETVGWGGDNMDYLVLRSQDLLGLFLGEDSLADVSCKSSLTFP